jgi:signal transduction protein with GAF and PtsI domain
VSDYYEDAHPSTLRLLGIIIAEASGKPVTICGEMAGREEVIPTLLEIGFRALSISPPLIPTTKELIRSIDTRNSHGPMLIEVCFFESYELQSRYRDHRVFLCTQCKIENRPSTTFTTLPIYPEG